MVRTSATCATVLFAALIGVAGGAPAVGNFRDGETVRYPLVLLTGSTGDPNAARVTVMNKSQRSGERRVKGLAGGGAFKALVRLVEGENRLVIRCGDDETKLRLRYQLASSKYVVRAFYWTGSEGDTDYQAPDANDPQNWRDRLSTALMLMQCFTAERMNDIGLGRRTFNLEFDKTGRVKVHLLRGAATAKAYRAMDGQQLYAAAAGLLARRPANAMAVNLVVPAFTVFDANCAQPLGHTALGGGRLALFGGGCLFTWPGSPAQAQAAFMDARRVDAKRFFSDSNGRHVRWACASTTIGAALHELGHCFGLPHSTDRLDIMTRGHDYFNRLFTLVEPPTLRREQPYAFRREEIARWTPVSGRALAALRFFEPDRREWSDRIRTRFTLDRRARRIGVVSPDGLRYLGVRSVTKSAGVLAVRSVRLGADANSASVSLGDLARWAPRGAVQLVAIDGQGNTIQAAVSDLLAGPFVRTWRPAKVFVPWPDANSLPDVDAEKLAAIEASAAKAEPVTFAGPYADLLTVKGFRGRYRQAGYLMREIRVRKARRARLMTGSDDSLRMWLNGKQIAAVRGPRTARADSEMTTIELRPGVNRLVVEVGQVGGAWGLYLRITDEKGRPLKLTEAGELMRSR